MRFIIEKTFGQEFVAENWDEAKEYLSEICNLSEVEDDGM